MNLIEFFNETDNEIKGLEELKRLMDIAVKHEKLENVEFNIIFVDNDTIQNINKEYRKIDKVTDVITFALEDNLEFEFENCRILGDIYISFDKATEQSISYGHSLLREISFLCVHGFYHLLGYDHMDKEEEKVMFEKQEEVLNEAGITR